MWMHKSEKELMKIRQLKVNAYKKTRQPLILSLVLILIASIDIKIGFNKFDIQTLTPITWKAFFKEGIIIALIIGLIAFIFVYALQIILKRQIFLKPEAMICLKCEKSKSDDKIYQCDCGGEFVPLDELEWVEEKKPSSISVEK